MTLEEIIKQRLAETEKNLTESATQTEQKTEIVEEKIDEAACEVEKKEEKKEPVNDKDEVVIAPKKKITKESTEGSVSSQVSALLEAEGLSDGFKLQAVAIFEAAVADRVMQIEEKMQKEFDEQLAEAVAEIESDIDGFVTEAVQEWKQNNEVAIVQNFKTQQNESLVDGLMAVLKEHNIDLAEGKEDALETALSDVSKLEESVRAKESEKAALQEQINQLTAEKILESFRGKMTQTEFDRFEQLTESIAFDNAEQYTKQLSIVLENFSVFKAPTKAQPTVVTESVEAPVVVTAPAVNSNVAHYASFIAKKKI